MNPPQISVIIPVYNVEKYLRQCLESMISQSFANLEIICVNDGSTDNCLQILQEYAGLDSRIQIISQPNRGLSAARNAGLSKAKAEYVFFIDSDDYLESETLEKLYAAAQTTGADLIFSNVRTFPQTEADRAEAQNKQNYFDNVQPTPNSCRPLNDNPLKITAVAASKLYKNSIIKRFNLSFPAQRLIHEDEYWLWAYGIHCNSYYCMPDKLYNYRIHSASITGSEYNSSRPLDIIDIDILITEELKRFNLLEKYRPMLEKSFCQHLANALTKCGRQHYPTARQKMAAYLQNPDFSAAFKNNIKELTDAEIPVSVIIPVYNTEAWLPACLDSLLEQTTDIFEIICVNDGSTDRSLQILEQYAAHDSRIRIVSQPNRGSGAARNAGLEKVQGTYVMFMDSDDWIEPETIKKTFKIMLNHQLDLLAYSMRIYDTSSKTFRYTPYHDFPAPLPAFSVRCPWQNPILMARLQHGGCNKIYRHALLQKNRIRFCENRQPGEDELFHLAHLPHVSAYGIFKEHLYNYRHPREGSIMSAFQGYSPENVRSLFGLLDGIFQLYQTHTDATIKKLFALRYFHHAEHIFKYYPVFKNHICYNLLRRQFKKQKTIFRDNSHLCPETYQLLKKIIRLSYLGYRFRQARSSFFHTPYGRTVLTSWKFVKSYFLFPWYTYQIYTFVKKRPSGKKL